MEGLYFFKKGMCCWG